MDEWASSLPVHIARVKASYGAGTLQPSVTPMLSQVLPAHCAQAHPEAERSADAHTLKRTSERILQRRLISRMSNR